MRAAKSLALTTLLCGFSLTRAHAQVLVSTHHAPREVAAYEATSSGGRQVFRADLGRGADGALAVGDLTGDSASEIIVTRTSPPYDGVLHVFDADGSLLGTIATELREERALAVADVTGDLKAEVLVASAGPSTCLIRDQPCGSVNVFSFQDGRGIGLGRITTFYEPGGFLAAGNVAGRDKAQILTAGFKRAQVAVHAFPGDFDGVPAINCQNACRGFLGTVNTNLAGGNSGLPRDEWPADGALLTADVDGDGRDEVLSWDGFPNPGGVRFWVIDAELEYGYGGHTRGGINTQFTGLARSAIAAGDIDHDGDDELVAGDGTSSFLQVASLGDAPISRPWIALSGGGSGQALAVMPAPRDDDCNGIDDDGNGLIDDGPGACLMRFLFVPFCWDGSQESFEIAAKEQLDFYLKSLDLYCPSNIGVEFGDVAAMRDAVDCSSGCVDNSQLASAIGSAFNVPSFTSVYAMTDRDLCGQIAGMNLGRIVWGEAFYDLGSGPETLEVVFAHELGHSAGFDEEYCSQEVGASHGSCNDATSINRMEAAVGCDPMAASCCDYAYRRDGTMPASGPCGGGLDRCCLGNLARDRATGDLNREGGRCIMSNASADGPRGWCPHCWQHWKEGLTTPVDCRARYEGSTPIIDLRLRMEDGALTFLSGETTTGREGINAREPRGNFAIEIFDARGDTMWSRRFAPERMLSDWPEPYTPTAIDLSFNGPLTRRVDVKEPLTIIFTENDKFRSQLTMRGNPPVADAGKDDTIACTHPYGAVQTVDAGGSYDPEGDTLRFAWSGPVKQTTSHSPQATAYLPMGKTTLNVRVRDGVHEVEDEVTYVVMDQTAPTVSLAAAPTLSVCAGERVLVKLTPPTITDACTNASDIKRQAFLTHLGGKKLATPRAIDPNKPSLELPAGESIVVWVAADAAGNRQSVTQRIVVNTRASLLCWAGFPTDALVPSSTWW